MLKVSDLVKMPGKKDTNCPGHEDNICDCDFGWCEGYNQALSEVSSLPISKDKVIGMVIFDRERLARTIADNRGGHRGFPPSSWDYQEADAIISAKSDILTIKGDV